jgi:hypothetical protein
MIMAIPTRLECKMAPKALVTLLLLFCASPAVFAAGPTKAQEQGAEAFLRAVATGSPETVAQELHPDELDKLRQRLLALLRAEGLQGSSTYRSRLFGPGRSLAQLESSTAGKFYTQLSERLRLRAREYASYDWLAAVPDGKVVYLIGKGEQPKDRGSVKVMVMVGLMQYGAQWRAIVPTEIEAQLDDLLEGRAAPAPAAAPGAGAGAGAGTAAPPDQPLAPGIGDLLTRAEASLVAGNCQQYYDEFMSPNFNHATSRSAKKTLVTACTNNESTRETMITTLRVVQELKPRYDMRGTRAVYDVSGQGLPYERFVLEREEGGRWYIAE